MSKVEKAEKECCASCGIAEVELKKCACKLVQYCSVDCQKNHRPQHKKLCKKRLAELRDKILYTQPDSSCYGECPICFLPLPIEPKQSNMMTCCSKSICLGCCYANTIRAHEAGLEQICAFCREPASLSEEGRNKQAMERIKKNDPVAMWQMGTKHHGEGDYESAVEYWTKASGMGNAPAHYELSCMYREGGGCVNKDMKKFIHHTEEAAIAGHPHARHNLGTIEFGNGRIERAVKHWVIAANLGVDVSLENVRRFYTIGKASKEDYAAALRGYQAALNATKSPKREEAKEFLGY